MLNEDLIDKKDLVIAKLKLKISRLEEAIKDFKAYDKERKEHYSSLEVKIGQLESYIQELETDPELKKLKVLNDDYKKQLGILSKRVFLDKIARMSDIEVNNTFNEVNLRELFKNKIKECTKLRKEKSDLLVELSKYRSMYETNKNRIIECKD